MTISTTDPAVPGRAARGQGTQSGDVVAAAGVSTVAVADIALETPRQQHVMSLLQQADEYLAALYPPESNHLMDIASLEQPGIAFFVARSNGHAVGCCAMVPAHDGTAEIKRMFVAPQARGQRLGRQLLDTLERYAQRCGIPVLRLETGIYQPEALGLYHSNGYREIGPFGGYLPDPLSLFMEKRLD